MSTLLRHAAVAAAFALAAGTASAESHGAGAAVRTGSNPGERGTMGGAGGAFAGAHQLSGTVTEVDKTQGALSLRSDSGDTLHLKFPPPVLADVAQGDRVTVQLALREDTGKLNEMDAREDAGSGSGARGGSGGAAGSR